MDIHESARKHGIDEVDIRHAVNHALAFEDVGEDPERWLVIGPDRASNLLEVVVLVTAAGDQLVIHAMPLRPKYRRFLDQ